MESASKKPTAILAANDAMAIGVIRYLKLAGYFVPKDVSVIGFDNVDAVHDAGMNMQINNSEKHLKLFKTVPESNNATTV